jgi:uncharacterized protein with GYD domain
MATYVTLSHWTQQGIEKVKDSPARLDAFKDALRKVGGQLKGFYLVMGRYDMVAIWEVPDDQAAAQVMLAAGARGSLRSETLRAYPEEEYRKILASLP